MQFLRIEIRHWRTFRNVVIEIPKDAPLVCLVGENGTGKSSIFEVIAGCAHRLGLSPGQDIPRGDPFNEPHDFGVVFKLQRCWNDLFHDAPTISDILRDNFERWDGTLSLTSQNLDLNERLDRITAGPDYNDPLLEHVAATVVEALRRSKAVLYLSLDADRSYPPIGFDANQYAQELIRPDVLAYQRQRSFSRSSAMFQEWERVTLAATTREATKFHNDYRRSINAGAQAPEFVDSYKAYDDAIQKVLPHLHFARSNDENSALLFDSSGTELPFSKLSGGEREIAFIIGQIERFKLRSGLLMIDEPELHLNPDLVRNWVAFLKNNVQDGQVWIATHSLEAVEAAGAENTFVLQRAADTRLVTEAFALSSRPVVSTLSAALGTPGFSISQLAFFYIEGERDGGEAQQFYDIYEDSRYVRFLEGGGGRDVGRKMDTLVNLARDAEQPLRVGAVLDRDFKSDIEVAGFEAQGLFVLGTHEIENFYLEPTSLSAAMGFTGAPQSAGQLVREASDLVAGRWIIQRALYGLNYNEKLSRAARVAKARPWTELLNDVNGFASATAVLLEITNFTFAQLETAILVAVEAYRECRESTDLWKHCFGKEVLSALAERAGYSGPDALRNAVIKLWHIGSVPKPGHVIDLVTYIKSIAAP